MSQTIRLSELVDRAQTLLHQLQLYTSPHDEPTSQLEIQPDSDGNSPESDVELIIGPRENPNLASNVDLYSPPRLCSKVPPVYIQFANLTQANVPFVLEDTFHPAAFEIRKTLDFSGLSLKWKDGGLKGDSIRILPCDYQTFKKILQICRLFKWTYFTYGLGGKRKLKVCIRGLPKDVNLAEIKRVIQSKNIPVCRVHNMHTTPGQERPALVMAVVNHNDQGRTIFQMHSLMGCDIVVERIKPKVEQCHRCQRWGHSQRHCQRPPQCVKCAGEHLSGKCPRPRTEPPTCANCTREHTANYKLCPKAKWYLGLEN